ncbi:hypothetical protein H5410_036563, partial [Solanum commersonii]
SEVWSPISSPTHEHLNNYLQNEELIISESAKDKVVDETKNQKATSKGKLPASKLYELKSVCPKVGEKERGTSEIKLKIEENYDYSEDVAILKSIYHYFLNHGVIPYPNYSENFINYIETSIFNLKFRSQELKTKIIMIERRFLTIFKITGYDPNIINSIYREMFLLVYGFMGLIWETIIKLAKR